MEKLSHAYIVSSADADVCLEKAISLAQMMLCTSPGKRPCGVCRDCRKIAARIHPDVMHIGRATDDKGVKKPLIPVDSVRAMSADAVVLPNEARGKVYIVEDAEYMNEQAQNAALKLLEEPPKGVHFILCTANPQRILITIRSRCVELHCNSEAGYDEGMLTAAREYIACLGRGNAAEITAWCFEHEKLELRELPEFLECVKKELSEKLPGSSCRKSVMENIRLVDRCLDYGRVNTGVKHIMGLLAVRSVPLTEEIN